MSLKSKLDSEVNINSSFHLPLSYNYTFQVHKSKKSKEIVSQENLRELGTAKSIDGFWMQFNNTLLPSHLPPSQEYLFFKQSIVNMLPTIEDFEGGHWVIFVDRAHKHLLDCLWRNLLVFIVCNRMVNNDVNNPTQYIPGAVMSFRKHQQKLELFVHKADEKIIKSIGQSIKYQCGIPNDTQIVYQLNKDINTSNKVQSL